MGTRASRARTSRAVRSPKTRAREAGRDTLIEVRIRSDRLEDEFSDLLRDPEGGVRLIACRPSARRSGGHLLRWVELETRSPAGRERVRQLSRRAGPGAFSLATSGADRALVRLATPLPGVCEAVFAAGATCVSCPLLTPSVGDREASVRVLVPRNGEARLLRQALSQKLGEHATIERAGRPRSSAGMTPRQEQALRTAFALGYFAYPRRADLAAVAKRLGVGRSTTLELLRHAIQEIAAQRFPAEDRRPNRP
jgi:HTH DNA binding domain